MVSLTTWARYIVQKLDYSITVGWKNYKGGYITDAQLGDTIWKNLFQGKLTFLHSSRGEEVASGLNTLGSTLLVRRIPNANPGRVLVGDVVVLKDPESSDNYLVRRLAATEGYEMVSTNEEEQPFVLDRDECWVLADDQKLKPKEAKDSRTFGPVSMADIVGRAIYSLKTAVDHGPVRNSRPSMMRDSAVLEVELDVDEMVKNHKA
ncbi:hypothetical protein SAY87_006383 [Trapa incisa]|uniref:Mitochondrial inner membrane protease subunit 2 n=2 Tax=Trapa TaxID=22665 RepID=A0AAN7KWJ8_TRANT|nr:hypothetical protein SAY87_006383 [Trapa incisa]KAK4774360.1 hypothetical protein SAY86_009295 [Trapa natans]